MWEAARGCQQRRLGGRREPDGHLCPALQHRQFAHTGTPSMLCRASWLCKHTDCKAHRRQTPTNTPSITSRVTVTAWRWPKRLHRPMACSSKVGFSTGSHSTCGQHQFGTINCNNTSQRQHRWEGPDCVPGHALLAPPEPTAALPGQEIGRCCCCHAHPNHYRTAG